MKKYIITILLACIAVIGSSQLLNVSAEVYITKDDRVELVDDEWLFVNGNTYYVEYVESESPDYHVYFVRDHVRTNRYYYYIFDTRTSPYIVHYSARWPHRHHRAPVYSRTRIPYATRPIPHKAPMYIDHHRGNGPVGTHRGNPAPRHHHR